LDVHVEPIYGTGSLSAEGPPPVVGAVIAATFAAPAVRGVHTLVIRVDRVYLLLATIDLTRMP
jgi:hypothetical protein